MGKNIWRVPRHHTHELKSFDCPNPEAIDHKSFARRASAIDGTSVNILGARRPASELEMSAYREVFSTRKLDQALKSLRTSMLRRFKGRKVDQIFNMVDTDGSGRIDRLELKVLLRKLGLFHMFPGKVIDAIF